MDGDRREAIGILVIAPPPGGEEERVDLLDVERSQLEHAAPPSRECREEVADVAGRNRIDRHFDVRAVTSIDERGAPGTMGRVVAHAVRHLHGVTARDAEGSDPSFDPCAERTTGHGDRQQHDQPDPERGDDQLLVVPPQPEHRQGHRREHRAETGPGQHVRLRWCEVPARCR